MIQLTLGIIEQFRLTFWYQKELVAKTSTTIKLTCFFVQQVYEHLGNRLNVDVKLTQLMLN